jgi:hypothetical protein
MFNLLRIRKVLCDIFSIYEFIEGIIKLNLQGFFIDLYFINKLFFLKRILFKKEWYFPINISLFIFKRKFFLFI